MNSVLSVSRRSAITAFRRAPATSVSTAATAAVGARGVSTTPALKQAYNYMWKSNAAYVTYVVVGAVVVEMVYGTFGDAIFNLANKGKQYHDTDWSKFKEEEEEEDDDDE